MDPDKRLYNQTFGNEKRHCKSDQQSWQHIRGYHELAKIIVPSVLEGHWCPPPHLFAVIEKRTGAVKDSLLIFCPFKFLDLLPALNV